MWRACLCANATTVRRSTDRCGVQAISLRDATLSDFPAICALNLAEVAQTSPMNQARLTQLHALAWYHKVACVDDQVVAFLLAMRADAPYQNDNFEWFARRYPQFVYVDRIVVAAEYAGLRIGARLYEDLYQCARAAAILHIACEYNLIPANEPSRRFHDRFGFKEQGQQWVANHSKLVSLQVAEILERSEEP